MDLKTIVPKYRVTLFGQPIREITKVSEDLSNLPYCEVSNLMLNKSNCITGNLKDLEAIDITWFNLAKCKWPEL